MAFNPSQDAGAAPTTPYNLVRNRVLQQQTDPTVPTTPASTAPTVQSAPFAPAGPTKMPTPSTYTPPASTMPGGAPGQTSAAGNPAIPTTSGSPAPGTYTPPPSAFADPTANQQVPLGSASTDPMNADFIHQQIATYADQHRHDPGFDQSLIADPGYWIQKIQSTGGWQGSNASYWTGKFASANQQAPGGGGTTGTATATAPDNAFTDQVRQMLMARRAADSQPVNETDQNIAAPLDAARLEADRATQTGRTALAEQLYAQGDLGSNSLNQGIQQMAEKNATGLSQVRASLIANEYANRRSDLNDAMQQALATGDAESARQIQLAIANLDATVQREGIGAGLTESATSADTAAVLALLHP